MRIKKCLSVILCLLLSLSALGLNVSADPIPPKTVEVYIASQKGGAFLCAPGVYTVGEDTAEKYGFTDSVDGVSALDALIAAHELTFGDAFTASTANTYFAESGGYISTVFGIETNAFGFMLNGGFPNDGTESVYGGYNGTTPFTQELTDGDKVDFFIYRDQTNYSDIYTLIDGELLAAPGTELEIKASGAAAMAGYLYKTPNDFKAAAGPAERVSFAWVDEKGALTSIKGVTSDSAGNAVISIPADMAPGVYYITAKGKDKGNCPVIMAPTPVTVTDEITVNVSISANGDFVTANDGSLFNRLPVTLSYNYEYDIDDVLRAAHEKYADSEHGYSSGIGAYGPEIQKLWGNESGAFGYWQNDNAASSLSGPVSDGDFIYAFVYKDSALWSDAYTKFESDELCVPVDKEITVTLQKYDWPTYSYIPCPGASITVAELPDINEVTDSNGQAKLTFTKKGTYTVFAKDPTAPTVPASCAVTADEIISVTGITLPDSLEITENERARLSFEITPKNATDKTVLWDSSDDKTVSVTDGVVTGLKAGWADITATTGDGGFSDVCRVTVKEAPAAVQIMHNIAARLTDSGIASDLNAPWFAADLAAYLSLYPNTENRLDDEQIREFLDVVIPAADSATAPGDLAKYIIALRALGFDPTKVITSDFREINIPEKLKTLIEENNSAVTVFNLPYVIIAMSQDEGYIDKSYIDGLINTIVENKKKWQKSALGTDAATPILLALSPYYDTNSEVKDVIDETVEIVKNAQKDTGLIGNAASTGLALAAFSALGLDGAEIKKEDVSLIDGLMTQTTSSLDGFLPVANSFATEQGFRGLVAWQMLTGNIKKSIFDFSKNPLNTAQASWGSFCPVTVNVVPEGAVVTIEGQTPVSENKYDLPAGEYNYKVEKEGYVTAGGSFTVDSSEEASHTPKTINVSLSGKPSSGNKTITVSLKFLIHDANKCNGEYTYKSNSSAYKTLISGSVSLSEGQTVFDALDSLLKENKIDYVEKTYGYISSIDGLGEFDHGPNSGWLFMVNGKTSQKGCRDYTLTKNSTVTWFYTDDYTNELGSEPWTKGSGSGSSAAGFTVKFQSNGGTSFKSLNVQKGGSVELPEPEEREGFNFEGWYTDAECTKEFDPSAEITGNITLYAKWTQTEEEEKELFKDVAKDAWYYDSVKYVFEKGLMHGTDKGFEPDTEMTRAMLITVIYRAEADGKEYNSCPFEDVKSGDWYFNAVAWGFENGLISGTDEKTFSPNAKITREQTALILFRYAKMKGYPTDEYSELSGFKDTEFISDWALDAVKWANAAGILSGIGNDLISPKTYTTRAQTAALLTRFFKNNKE